MSIPATNPETASPLTALSEEESMLRDTVRQFAEREIAPLVRGMDEAQKLDPAILQQLFGDIAIDHTELVAIIAGRRAT